MNQDNEKLKAIIEKVLNKNIEFGVNLERADDPTGDIVDKDSLIKELSTLYTEEIAKGKREAVEEYIYMQQKFYEFLATGNIQRAMEKVEQMEKFLSQQTKGEGKK